MNLPNETKELTTDEFQRKHYKLSHSGQLYIVNRAQHFHNSTVEPHVNDLIQILPDYLSTGKSILILVVDNGPDWSINSFVNCLYFVRL